MLRDLLNSWAGGFLERAVLKKGRWIIYVGNKSKYQTSHPPIYIGVILRKCTSDCCGGRNNHITIKCIGDHIDNRLGPENTACLNIDMCFTWK